MNPTLVALLALCLCVAGCATFKDVGKQLWPSGQSNPQQAADKGKPLPKDFKSLKALAEKGDARAQFQLANKFYYGEEVAKDYVQSFEWASRSAAQDNPKAKYRLASLYLQGIGIAKDEDKAMALFKECAEGIRKLAEQNDAQAQSNLGWMYHTGQGVEQDFKEALKWFQEAADQGDAFAQLYLGVMHANGEGVEKDFKEAVKWYQKAADQGIASAQYALGMMYFEGQGVEKDSKEVVKWWRKSAEQGIVVAQYNLGLMYGGMREGVKKDFRESVKWWEKAAEQGFAHAQSILGLMYANGQGVEQNYVTAYAWRNIAATNGNQSAQKDLPQVAKEMTPEQITEAEALVKEMVKKNPKLLKK